jgi:hypothetical protein
MPSFFANASMFHEDIKNVSDVSLFAGCDIFQYGMKQNSLAKLKNNRTFAP